MDLRRPRPSSLQIAKDCLRAPWLGNKYPQSTQATQYGSAVDAAISEAINDGVVPAEPMALVLWTWLSSLFPADATYYVQRKVTLYDPNTGDVITAGTPDLLVVYALEGRRILVVVDWKTIGQFWAGYLAQPDENLQQLTYMVAAGMEFGADETRVVIALYDVNRIKPLESKVYRATDWWPVIDLIKSVPAVEMDGPEPEARMGGHCDKCWQRQHCSAYLMPAIKDVPVALAPFVEGGAELTDETAAAGVLWLDRAYDAIKRAKKVADQVEGQLGAYALKRGGAIRVGEDRLWGANSKPGSRRGPTLDELEQMGLGHLIKPGKPSVAFDWKKEGGR